MLQYPHIDPVFFSIGPLEVKWYGLMYLLSFIACYILVRRRLRTEKQYENFITYEQWSDVVFAGVLGVIFGGRIGYILFYGWSEWARDPWWFLKIWEGGMSFHGGFIGVVIAIVVMSRRYGRNPFDLAELLAPFVPIGLGLGRLGNFINGELWGRVSNVQWAMVFPGAGSLARHPSQLYQFALEGVLLFLILFVFSTTKERPRYAVTGLFITLYGIFRFVVEFFREPDVQIGFVFENWMTMGQLLSLPMILFGFVFIVMSQINPVYLSSFKLTSAQENLDIKSNKATSKKRKHKK